MTNKGKLIEMVYASNLTQRATLVIFYLINRADKENTCFPGVKTIARECNISTRTVQRALNDLEEAGFLKRESRFHKQGGQRSNLFTVLNEEQLTEEDDNIQKIIFDESNESNDNEDVENQGGIILKSNVCNYSINHIETMNFTLYQSNSNLKTSLSWSGCQDGDP